MIIIWEYDNKRAGRLIQSRRKILKLTQNDLAERINRSPKLCADIEQGKSGMSLETMAATCNVLGITPDMLFGKKSDDAHDEAFNTIEHLLMNCSAKQREALCQVVRIFLEAGQ